MRAVMLGLLLLAAAADGRTVYGWRDAAGVPHFADRVLDAAARPVQPDDSRVSIISVPPAGENAMRPVLERERRWQEDNRARDRRRAQADIDERARRCGELGAQLAQAEARRQRQRVRELEERWYGGCRP